MMDDELRQQIRECVQQEMRSIQSTSRSTPQNTPPKNRVRASDLIARTRSIMQNAASSSQPNRTPNHAPNHPNRIGSKRKLNVKTTTHELQVLYPIDDEMVEHSISDANICIKEALINLESTMDEDDIRQKIVDVCKPKLQTIRKEDFDFVKKTKPSKQTSCGRRFQI